MGSLPQKAVSLNSRNQWLDVLRGVAILLVLVRHFNYPLMPMQHIGWAGVDLFFVLSGFLISGLLFSEYQRHGGIRLKEFWIRRGFKIYPPFYALLGFTALMILLRTRSLPKALLGDAFFLQNYAPHMLFHGWSLAVEEHFYFVLPVVLILLIRFRGVAPFRYLPYISIGLTLVCLYLRSLSQPEWFATHLRIDALFCGVTLGYYKYFQPESFPQTSQRWMLMLGLCLFAPVYFLDKSSIALTLAFLSSACILLWAVPRKPSRFPATRLLAWIGKYSYSIYLWHIWTSLLFCGILAHKFSMLQPDSTGHPSALVFGLYLIASIVWGMAMSKLIEVPALRLRDRLFPSANNHAPRSGELRLVPNWTNDSRASL